MRKNKMILFQVCFRTARYILVPFVFLLVFDSIGQDKMSQDKMISSHFVEVPEDLPRTEKNLRKWDSPVIADLDQDGFLDMLINDHGLGLSVCWNNQGRFAKPYDIIMGDLHGVTVGDFDDDGNLEIVVSRGGGSGGNARNSKIFRVDRQRNFSTVPDFMVPLELMRGRTVKFIDGDSDGTLDLLNFAFPDKDKNGQSENYIYKNSNGELVLQSTLPAVNTDGQKTLITDFNSDGEEDLLLYGEGSVKAFQGNGDLTYTDVSKTIFSDDIQHVKGIVELDFDNDGDFDVFITRGTEFEIGETFYDHETQTWGFFTKRGDFQFEDLVIGDVLNLENFQSQWPDNDAYYIGETAYAYEFPGETHSGKDIRLVNSDALGYPDRRENTGFYIGYVGNQAWRLAGDIRAPATGVVHGVQSYPMYEHSNGFGDILLENRNGKYVDVTQEANLFLEEHTVGSAVSDFDNNGFSDLIIIRRGDLIHANESMIYLNKGEAGFVKLKDHGVLSTELGAIGMCVETIDYNRDNKVDIVIGNERGKWHLFKNTLRGTEENKSFVVEVGHSPTGKATALGAIVEVTSCNNKQIHRVGSTGANYSQSFNKYVHFGLGTCNETPDVEVTWTNGEKEKRQVTNIKDGLFIGK